MRKVFCLVLLLAFFGIQDVYAARTDFNVQRQGFDYYHTREEVESWNPHQINWWANNIKAALLRDGIAYSTVNNDRYILEPSQAKPAPPFVSSAQVKAR